MFISTDKLTNCVYTYVYVWMLILGGGGGGGHPYRRSGGYNDRRYNRGNNE